MTTPASCSVSMIFFNNNLQPVINIRPRWGRMHALYVRKKLKDTTMKATKLLTLVFATALYGCGSDDPKDISSIEDAQKFLIGTWTQTGQEAQNHLGTLWTKWEVKPGGKLDVYEAQANSDNWGKPKELTYQVITEKFKNTGKRFFALEPSYSYPAVIMPNGNLHLQVPKMTVLNVTGGGYTMKFVRGDKNPFDK